MNDTYLEDATQIIKLFVRIFVGPIDLFKRVGHILYTCTTVILSQSLPLYVYRAVYICYYTSTYIPRTLKDPTSDPYI